MGSISNWLEGHDIDDVVSSLVFSRGRDLWIRGHCVSVRQRLDGILEAQVRGSKDNVYDITVVASRSQLVARCTCPFETMVCKHVVCALLAWKADARSRSDAELDTPDGAPGAALTRMTPRTAVFAWARDRGVEHWLSASPAFVPQLRPAAKAASAELLRARMLQLVDFFGRDSRWSHISDSVVDHIVAFIEERARAVAEWRPEDAKRRWAPVTDDLALERVVAQLTALRASLREATPGREPAARTATTVTLVPWPPGISVHFSAHPMVAGLGITTLAPVWGEHTVRLRFDDDGIDFADGADTPGELAVEAVEAALDALCADDDHAMALALRDELQKPLWRRMVETMRREVAAVSPAPLSHGQEEGELGWRVSVGRHDLQVTPVFVRAKKTGSGWILRKLSLNKLTQTPRRWDHPGDALALAALEPETPRAAYAALLQLVGHPRVFSSEGDARRLTVQRTRLVQAVRATDDGVELGFELNGEFLEPGAVRALIGGAVTDLAVTCELERARVTVIDVPPEAPGLLATWRELGNRIPTEGVPELVEYLAEASEHAEMSLPNELAGEDVPPDSRPFLQLEAPPDATVIARLAVRPLAERASEAPGSGPERLLGRRDGRVVHCQRDLGAELTAAAQMAALLGVEPHESGLRWEWGFSAIDDVLDLLARAREAEIRVEWGSEQRYQVRRTITGADLTVRAEGAKGRDWFGLEGGVKVGDDVIPLREVLRALRERRRYVRVGEGEWAAIDAQLQRRLDALAQTATSDKKGEERLSMLAAPLVAGLEEIGATVVGAGTWLERMEAMREAADLAVPIPEGFVGDLRDYQREGFEWLAQLAHWASGACLADDMGLGKTIQALALMLRRAPDGPQLVVAPTSLGFNWEREAEKFAPSLRVRLFRGAGSLEVLTGELGPSDVIVTSYDLVARYATELAATVFATVVLDEAQAIKNPSTQRARAVYALRGEFVLALTGTPVENRTGEIWSLFHAIAPGLLGSARAFREAFALPIERFERPGARESLASMVRPFVLRRLKREVAKELPARTDIRMEVELSASERALYEEMRDAAAATLLGNRESEGGVAPQQRFIVLQALTRLRQLACHPRLVDPASPVRSSKLEVVRELVGELRDEGHRALIFSQFTTLLGLVRAALEEDGVRCRYLDGQTPEHQRRVEVDAFQDGDGDVFLLSLKAGGTGLNLTGADYVIHLDPWWNPAAEDQATDRAHRIGQDKPVTVIRLVARGTVEEGIMKLHADKRELAEALLAGTDSARSMTIEELSALIRGANEVREAPAEDASET